MTRLADILLRARDTLSDPDSERWTDTELLRLVDEGQKTLVQKAHLLRSRTTITLVTNTAEYSLPTDTHRPSRILNEDGSPLPLYSHKRMDKIYGSTWEADTGGTVEAIVYDKISPQTLKIYPLLTTVTAPTAAQLATMVSSYGVVVSGSIGSTGPIILSPMYGVLAGVTQYTTTELIVYYYRKPATITTTADTLDIEDIFDDTLKFYVTGMALRNDKDTLNRQLGLDELKLFTAGLRGAVKEASLDYTGHNTQYNSAYIGGV